MATMQMDPDDIARFQRHSEGPPMIFWVMYFGFLSVVLVGAAVCGWKIFQKAGQPGWAALVPIYNIVIILQMIGKPIWWIALMFVPCVNIVVQVLIAVELAARFGKSTGYAIGMILLPFIFYPMLAFGDAQYSPPPYPQTN
jgi:hypothetical protein